jgi:cyclophilin family peptidyl-prolyl cis-trans isomerase
MKKLTFFLLMTCSSLLMKAQPAFVRLETDKGKITLMLYDETPKHRDAFLKMVKDGFYNKTLFNRVIKSFVSQGGELDDTILDREKLHPEQPLKRIPAEFSETIIHKKGAFGAGRNDNPEKSDYYTQVYLVQGKVHTDASVNLLEQKSGRKIPAAQREIYKTIGGSPELDQDYTIFGEVVDGMDVAEAINMVPTHKNDLPLTPVHFKAVVLSKKEGITLWKKMSQNTVNTLPLHK